MWRIVVIAFLLGHGVVVAAQVLGVPESWLVGDRRLVGALFTLTAGACLVISGVALWVHADWWRPLAVAGAAVSLTYFVGFFQPAVLFGMALDVAVVVALAWFRWPSDSMVGA